MQAVRDSQRIRIVKQKDVHAYRSIIIIKGAKKEDEGLYEITVKNREGEAKNTITLKVTVRLLLYYCTYFSGPKRSTCTVFGFV